MRKHDKSRRDFLQNSVAVTGASWAKLVLPSVAALSQAACTAKDENAPFTVLTDAEAVELEAIAARIIPTTDTPGAREAGVIHFLDQTFGTFNAQLLPPTRSGLEELQESIDGSRLFSALSEEEQDTVLEATQDTAFFGLMRMLTFSGFFGMSKYGGNKGGVGWALLGMDHTEHTYHSPFGYYDAEYLKENPSG